MTWWWSVVRSHLRLSVTRISELVAGGDLNLRQVQSSWPLQDSLASSERSSLFRSEQKQLGGVLLRSTGFLFGYTPPSFWALGPFVNKTSCWASGLVGGSRSEPSPGPRGQLSGSYRFLTIGFSYKVTVIFRSISLQSDREFPYKVTVDNSLD